MVFLVWVMVARIWRSHCLGDGLTKPHVYFMSTSSHSAAVTVEFKNVVVLFAVPSALLSERRANENPPRFR